MRRAFHSALQKHFGLGPQQAAADDKRRALFQQLESIIALSRRLPSVQLFDAVWQLTFSWLDEACRNARAYLQEQYFCARSARKHSEANAVHAAVVGLRGCLVRGLLASGLESYLSRQLVRHANAGEFSVVLATEHRSQSLRARPTEILSCMQDQWQTEEKGPVSSLAASAAYQAEHRTGCTPIGIKALNLRLRTSASCLYLSLR